MPIYDFQCTRCGLLQDDIPCPTADYAKQIEQHRPCPKCGGRLKKVVPARTSFTMGKKP